MLANQKKRCILWRIRIGRKVGTMGFFAKFATLFHAAGKVGISACTDSFVTPRTVITRTADPIVLGGELSEPAWNKTPAYALSQVRYGGEPREVARAAQDPFEPGEVRFLYDDRYLYVGAVLQDRDIFNDCDRNQERLFRYGDLLEFFVMPMGSNYCWEFYAAPNGAKSSFFYPGCSFGLIESVFKVDPANLMPGFEVSTFVKGDLATHTGKDESWTVKMRIPLDELAKQGVPFDPGHPWSVLVARYNYGVNLYQKQGSSWPPLPSPGYNQTQYYSPVDFR